MQDLILSERDSDLLFRNSDLVMSSEADAIAQRIQSKLRLIRGEYFRNRRAGVPYFEKILQKNPRSEIVRSVIRRTISDDTDVEKIESLNFDFDGTTRRMTIRFTVKVANSSGTVVTSEVEV